MSGDAGHGAAVRIEACAKTFADGTRALESATLDIARGETLVLLGPSGCGKTTMLRIIAGLEQPDAGGKVLFDGRDMTAVPIERRNVGMVFQSYALFPNMTVSENIGYGLKIRGVSARERAERVAELVELTNISGLENRRVDQLSGGQRQRVALARAVAIRPGILLLDEPLTALDAALRDRLRSELNRLLRALGITAIYVTHDQSEAMTTADLIAVMNGGRIDQLGTPEDIYARPESEFVARFIGASNVIKGIARDTDHVSFAGAMLKVVGAPLASGQSAVVAIRQHDIGLTTKAPASPENALRAVVKRQVYLGAARDYLVEIADGSTLRVVTPTETNVAKGSEVWLTLPPERCRALSR